MAQSITVLSAKNLGATMNLSNKNRSLLFLWFFYCLFICFFTTSVFKEAKAAAMSDDEELGASTIDAYKDTIDDQLLLVLVKQVAEDMQPSDLFQELIIAKIMSDYGIGPQIYSAEIVYEEIWERPETQTYFSFSHGYYEIKFDQLNQKLKPFFDLNNLNKNHMFDDWGVLFEGKLNEFISNQNPLKRDLGLICHRTYKTIDFRFKAEEDFDSDFAVKAYKKMSFLYDPKNFWNFANKLISKIKLMHDMGIYHGDLKPENLLFTNISGSSYDLLICDFGSSGNYMHLIDEMIILRKMSTFKMPDVSFSPAQRDIWSIGMTLYLIYMNFPKGEPNSKSIFMRNQTMEQEFVFSFLKSLLLPDPKAQISLDKALNHTELMLFDPNEHIADLDIADIWKF